MTGEDLATPTELSSGWKPGMQRGVGTAGEPRFGPCRQPTVESARSHAGRRCQGGDRAAWRKGGATGGQRGGDHGGTRRVVERLQPWSPRTPSIAAMSSGRSSSTVVLDEVQVDVDVVVSEVGPIPIAGFHGDGRRRGPRLPRDPRGASPTLLDALGHGIDGLEVVSPARAPLRGWLIAIRAFSAALPSAPDPGHP